MGNGVYVVKKIMFTEYDMSNKPLSWHFGGSVWLSKENSQLSMKNGLAVLTWFNILNEPSGGF